MPTGEQVDAWYTAELPKRLAALDANDLIYQLEASRTYDPSMDLEKIKAPPSTGELRRRLHQPRRSSAWPRAEVKRIQGGKFVLIPAGPNTPRPRHHTPGQSSGRTTLRIC